MVRNWMQEFAGSEDSLKLSIKNLGKSRMCNDAMIY